MKKTSYSPTIANAICSVLEKDDTNYSFDSVRGIFRFGIEVEPLNFRIDYSIYVREDEFIVYVLYPLCIETTDKEIMSAVAEFICRANCSVRNGNFEFDMNSGEIWFKKDVVCAGIEPTSVMIKKSIYQSEAMIRLFREGFKDVISKKLTPGEAVEKCKHDLTQGLFVLCFDHMCYMESRKEAMTRKESSDDELDDIEIDFDDEFYEDYIDLFGADTEDDNPSPACGRAGNTEDEPEIRLDPFKK